MAVPLAVNPFELGILNNKGFISNYISENLLTETLMFAPLEIWPIIAPWDHLGLPALCTIYVETRYSFNAVANPALKKAMVAEETISMKIPTAKLATPATARTSVMTWMKHGITNNIFDVIGNYNDANYQEFKQREDVIARFAVANAPVAYPHPPPTAEEIAALNATMIVYMMYYYATYIRQELRFMAIENITLAYSSLLKRGYVTDKFCANVQNCLRDKLGITIHLNQATMNALYKGYLQEVNEENAAGVFSSLDSLVPDIALRLKLTLNLAAGSKLTCYIIICRVYRMCHDFPWESANTLTGNEFQNWEVARAHIGDNPYYGFRRDMGPAHSILYKSIGYVAKELLVRLNGERTLNRCAFLWGYIKNKDSLDKLIINYVVHQPATIHTDIPINNTSF